MRPIIRCMACLASLLLCQASSHAAETHTATVTSGAKSRITGHTAIDNKTCTPQRVEIKVLAPPANGELSIAPETVVLPKQTRRGGAQPCAGVSLKGVAIFYRSKPDFKGEDRFRYSRINTDNPGSPLNGELSYNVTVK